MLKSIRHFVFSLSKASVALLLLAGLNACESEPFESETTNGTGNQRLVVTTRDFYTLTQDSILPNVLVKLYKTRDDRSYDYDVQKYGNTDSSGTITFHYLKEPYYYVRATHAYGEQLEEVSIPENAEISYLEIRY